MASYAEIKGQPIKAAPVASNTAATPDGELSDDEIQRIAENKAFVLEHMPELVPLISALYAEGMIDGWRAITKCTLKERQ